MKIPAAKIEKSEAHLALPEPLPADPKVLAEWLGQEFGLDARHARIQREPARTVVWNGISVEQPPRWQRSPCVRRGNRGRPNTGRATVP
ncbi:MULTISPECIES: hypothetical protein [Methylomicrobium]|uniref:hypothetical protein n=1 Tax=Methylomicrobium TaxID=39773 RepID=UPI0002623E4C|nr:MULTISPECIES: hypothetical protein [Methylomicrobium]